MKENQLREEQRRLQELKDRLHLQAVKDKERFESSSLHWCHRVWHVVGLGGEKINAYKSWKRKEFCKIS